MFRLITAFSLVLASLIGCSSDKQGGPSPSPSPSLVASLHCDPDPSGDCSCDVEQATTAEFSSCTPLKSRAGVCCADNDWPSSGSCGCTQQIGCSGTADSCDCSDLFDPTQVMTSCPLPSPGTICCLDAQTTDTSNPSCNCFATDSVTLGCSSKRHQIKVPFCDAITVSKFYPLSCDASLTQVSVCSRDGNGGQSIMSSQPQPDQTCLWPSCHNSGVIPLSSSCTCTTSSGPCFQEQVNQTTGDCDAAQQEAVLSSKHARCCADSTYPSSGQCFCKPWRCESESSGSYSCKCGNSSSIQDQLDSCLDSICCQSSNGDTCECSPTLTQCPTGYTQVDFCDYDTCPAGTTNVDSCDDVVSS